jgi:hypothetical protein
MTPLAYPALMEKPGSGVSRGVVTNKVWGVIQSIADMYADAKEAEREAEDMARVPADPAAVDGVVISLMRQFDESQDGASWPEVSPGQCLVSTLKNEKRCNPNLPRDQVEEKVRGFVKRHAGGAWIPPIGLWLDESDRLVLDVNHVFTSINNSIVPPREALLTAVLNKQESIYFLPPNDSEAKYFKIPPFAEYRELVLGLSGGKFIMDFMEANRQH